MSLPTQIGPYQVVRELGRGGMGVVYEARRGDERVAVKVLLDLDASVERFLEEAKACARLNHPNLVRLLDAGQDRGRPYLAMAYVEGEPADARLRRQGRLDPPQAVALAVRLARAIQHVHDQGLLHRDLKPGNVLLTEQGPVLTDFGLARDEGRDRERLTKTGMLLGTPEFMAPEQAAGEVRRVGVATDVYGLGATFYALLTGSPPYTGSVVNVLHSVLKGDPPAPSTRAPGIGADLDAIVLRCLAEQPSDRFPSADALADALEAYLARRATPAAPTGRGVRVATAAILLGGLAAAGLVIARGRAPAAPRGQPPGPAASSLPETSASPGPPASALDRCCQAADAALRETALVPDLARIEEALADLADLPPDLHLDAQASAYRALLLRRLGRPEWVPEAEEASSAAPDAPLGWALRGCLVLAKLPPGPPPPGEVPQGALAALEEAKALLSRAERDGVEDYWYFVVGFQVRMALWSHGQLEPQAVIEPGRRACATFPGDPLLDSQLAEACLVLPAPEGVERATWLADVSARVDSALATVSDSPLLLLQRGRLQEQRLVWLEQAGGPAPERERARAGMEQDLRRAGELDPMLELPLRLLAMRYDREGDLEQSADLWEQVVERAPHEPLHWIALALTTRRCARWERLTEVLGVLTDRFPALPDTWGVAAECRLIHAFYRSTDPALADAALEAAERFREQAPDRPRSQVVLAMARRMTADPAWDRDLPAEPPPAPTPLLRTMLLTRARVRELEPAIVRRKQADARGNQADARRHQADARRALERCYALLDAATRADPRQFWTFVEAIYLWDIAWTEIDPSYWTEAERFHRRLVVHMPWEAYFHFRLGWHLKHPIYLMLVSRPDSRPAIPPSDQDQLRESIPHYTRALEIDPGWSSPWKERGFVHHLLNDEARAADDFTRCLQRDPNDFIATQLLGNALLALNQFGEALDAYLRTLELDPANQTALRTVVQLALDRGQSDMALARIDQALAIRPGDLPNRVLRAEVLERREAWEAAREEYRRCLGLVPAGSEESAELTRRLDALNGR